MGEILGRGTDQRDSANVDLFDDLLIIAGPGHSIFKRVEVDDHQVNRLNIILFYVMQIGQLIPAPEDSPENLRMKGLHSSSKD